MERIGISCRLFDTNGEKPMNLLPLQIVLGFQIAAAVVIAIQLMKRDDGDEPLRAEQVRRAEAARRRISGRSWHHAAR